VRSWRSTKGKGTRRMAIANATCVSVILASPEYVPGTIAVNVTRMERGFNDGQTHCSMYPSIFNRIRAIQRYWLEIATFSYPLHLAPPLGVFPLEFREKFSPHDHGPTRQWRQCDDRLSHFDTIPAVWLTHVKKVKTDMCIAPHSKYR